MHDISIAMWWRAVDWDHTQHARCSLFVCVSFTQARQKKIIQCHHLPKLFPHPVLLTMVRNEELVVPEKKPPEPELHQPYYLGLVHRARRECDPPVIPKPPLREPCYVQLSSLLRRRMELAGPGGSRRSAKDRWAEAASIDTVQYVCKH